MVSEPKCRWLSVTCLTRKARGAAIFAWIMLKIPAERQFAFAWGNLNISGAPRDFGSFSTKNWLLGAKIFKNLWIFFILLEIFHCLGSVMERNLCHRVLQKCPETSAAEVLAQKVSYFWQDRTLGHQKNFLLSKQVLPFQVLSVPRWESDFLSLILAN